MIHLMSFNIRYGTADDGDQRWERRRSLVIDRIRQFDPDLLGLQECRDDTQAEYVQSQLQEYEFFGVPRGGDGSTALEMAPILFKKTVFKPIQKGVFWLSDTPHVAGSISWGSVFPRTAVWIELLHQPTGRSLLFLNTHFDYQMSAIERSSDLLRQWLDQALIRHPLLVTGDFNADKDSQAYQQLTRNPSLRDVFKAVPLEDGNEGTFHGYGQELQPIDWMLASQHFKVSHAGVDRFQAGSLYPSDHYPITASLEWNEGP
jgi:endonuclease/exonuclease/phosphatase family metal-dependent hydrolase